MNERIRKLRNESLTTRASISLERARLETEAYQMFEGRVSVPELRALALRHILEHKKLCINRGELIVGEKGEGPQSAPSFPELCCHTIADLKLMNERELISFCVKDEDFRVQQETIIPFWAQRSIRSRIWSDMTPEWQDCYAAGIFTEFMEQRGPGHTVGSANIFSKGFEAYMQEIDKTLSRLDFLGDPDAEAKSEQLRAMRICCEAIILFGRRYADYARTLAEQEIDPAWRGELQQIAANCDIVPAKKPETYWQALQMYWFVHLGVTTELNPWDAYSPGRLDQHLLPFYQQDIRDGRLNDDHARELLECLWIKFNNQPAPPKVGITLKESGTYTDFANINTGGIAVDGEDGVNAVSYLILDCMDEMRLLQPSSNVQISRKTPLPFLKRACEISLKGWGQPAFYSTEAIIQELLNAGKTLEDARQGGTSGCVETGAFGNEAYILTGYFNLPKILELTLNNGFDRVSGKQLGLKLGQAFDFGSYEALFSAYQKQINHFVDVKVAGSNRIEMIFARYMPVPFLSIITNDCIARGKDYNAGGARYNTSYIQGVGIGTVTDSLAAIKFNVFDRKTFSMTQLVKALHDDFAGHETIRNQVRNRTPHYGNDDEYADGIMKDVFHAYHRAVTGRPNMKGGHYRINMLPTTCHIYFGEVTEASANGRLAAKPLSEGISPSQGADRLGPTAVLHSAAKMDQLITGGTLLNQKLNPEAVRGTIGQDIMASLVRAYFDMNGHHIQFNIVDEQTLRAAQKDPDAYRDLIVRVAGYSDYFNNLSRTLQDEIISRTEQNLG